MEMEITSVKGGQYGLIHFQAVITTRREFAEFSKLMDKYRDGRPFQIHLDDDEVDETLSYGQCRKGISGKEGD